MAKIERALILRVNHPKSLEYAAQCAESCDKHGIPWEYFEGYYKIDPPLLSIVTGWDVRAPKFVLAKNNIPNEFCASMGHIKMWENIAASGQTTAVFEHDVIVKQNFLDIDIPDGVVALLGYRVHKHTDYEPISEPRELVDIPRFEGAHAYAMTPATAATAVQRMNKTMPCSIDGVLGIHNLIKMRRMLVNPPPVVCEVGDRMSTCQDDGCAMYNDYVSPEFLEGLCANKERYQINPENGIMEFVYAPDAT